MARPENGSNSVHADPGQAIETIIGRSAQKPIVPAEDIREITRIVHQERIGTTSNEMCENDAAWKNFVDNMNA